MIGILVCSACGKDSAAEGNAAAPSATSEHEPAVDASPPTPTVVAADEYCDHLCGRAKTCNESFDHQTCARECNSESGVITNLNPSLLEGLYECVERTSCSTVAAQRFTAPCLAHAATGLRPSGAGKAFCEELERAADECSFTDYDERACWQISSAFSDAVLASAAICAKKKCSLIVSCLDATMKVPSEVDGTPMGFDEGEFSSGAAARPASASLFPKTADVVVSPSTSHSGASSGDARPAQSADTTHHEPPVDSMPVDTVSLDTAPPKIEPPKIDINAPDVQAQYCTDAEACTDCRLTACCAETLTCLTTESCVEWLTCVTDCRPSDGTCQDDCRRIYAAGEDAAFEYIECFTEATNGECANVCDASDAGGETSNPTSASGDVTVTQPTSDVASAPAGSESTSAADSSDVGVPTCNECLGAACDPEITACVDDDPCFYLYFDYVYCWEASTTDEEVSACFEPYYEAYLTYEPASAALYQAMTACFANADCPVCD